MLGSIALATPARAADRLPIDINGSAGKLPGQIATILGNNGISGITSNLNQVLSNVNLVDSTLQNVASTISNMVVLPG